MVYSNFGTQGGATKLIFEGLTISVACVLRREKIFELSYQIITQRHYIKTCVERLLSKRPKSGFQDKLSLNAWQKYRRECCNTSDLH